ncbi:MAG: adenylate/guanylate cyclase domain-containing protein [Elusimicrobiota bacterium]
MKNNGAKESSKLIFVFGVVFTSFMLISMVVGGVIRTGGWLRNINNSWSDFRKKFPGVVSSIITDNPQNYSYAFGRPFNKAADSRISIAAIDEHTLNNLGYPFPRKHYARMIENLNKLGAKVIAMDIFILDPDKRDVQSDRAFVEAVRKAGNVINLVNTDRDNAKFSLPISGLAESSRYVAIPNVEQALDSDGQVRRLYLFDQDLRYSDITGLKLSCPKTECGLVGLPGLSAAAYAVYSGTPLPKLWIDYDGLYSLNFRYPVSRKSHPGWSKDKATNYSIHRYISVLDIIENKLSSEEREAIKGGIIFVGSTAMGAFDHYPSVFMTPLPGVEVHANAADNILNNDLVRPVSSMLIAILLTICIWLVIFLRRFSTQCIVFSTLGLLAFFILVDYYLLCRFYDLGFMTIATGIFIPFIYVSVNKALVEGREKKWIKNTFGQYLSPKVVELITKDPSKLSLGGEKRDMTAFFLDIAGFTTMSEKMTPEQLTKMLNNYLSGLTDVILRHDGVVDKYIGDCVMAFWNAPLDQKDHRKLACLAAVDCMAEINRLNQELTEYSIKPSARIGLNSGPMVVGNMGSKMRLSYTVMGDAVNLASRLEGANKYFHSKIMVSEYTYEEAKDFVESRLLGQIRVVGKAIPVKVYELLAHKGKLTEEGQKLLAAYNEGHEAFFKGAYGPAKKAFEAALAIAPADGPSKFYLDLAAKYAVETPKDWDGTFNLTSK